MHFKLIMVLAKDKETKLIMDTAREAGATGSTVITSAKGEGLEPGKTFFGLDLAAQVDVLLLLVEEHLSRSILEKIAKAGQFNKTAGTGIAFQIDIEDAVGLGSQIETISKEIEEKI